MTQKYMPTLFLGRWELDATQSNYQLGDLPQSGLYTLESEADQLKITMVWTATDVQKHNIVYYVMPDG